MNILINLLMFESKEQLSALLVNINSKNNLLDKLKQSIADTGDTRYFFIVDNNIKEEIKYYLPTEDSYIIVEDCDKEAWANISVKNVVSILKQYEIDLDYSASLIFLDGNYYVNDYIFDFSGCQDNVNIILEAIADKNVYDDFKLFYYAPNAEKIKTVSISIDSKLVYNLLSFLKLSFKTSVFSTNDEMKLGLINQLNSEFRFDEVLSNLEQFSEDSLVWSLYYIKTLIFNGNLSKLNNFLSKNSHILANKLVLSDYYATFADSIAAIQNFEKNKTIVIPACGMDITEEFLYSIDITEFIKVHGKELFDFRKNYRYKQLLTGHIVNMLINRDRLTTNLTGDYIKYLTHRHINVLGMKYMICKVIDYIIDYNLESIDYQYYGLGPKINHLLLSQFDSYQVGARLYYTKLQKRLDIKLNDNGATPKIVFDKTNNKKPRVAVCISGMCRNDYRHNLKNFKTFIIDPLDADVFVHTWDKSEIYPGVGGLGAGDEKKWAEKFFKEIQNEQPKTILTEGGLKALFPNTAQKILDTVETDTDEKIFYEVFGSKLKKLDLNSHSDFEKKVDKPGIKRRGNFNQAKMLYGIQKSFELVEQVENELELKYDYVVRVRIDSTFSKKLEICSLKKLHSNQILIPTAFGYGVEDRLFMGRYSVMKKLCRMWDMIIENEDLSPYIQNNKKLTIDSHKLFLTHIMYNQIEVRPLEFRDTVVQYLSKIQVPNFERELEADLLNITDEYGAYKNYFTKLLDQYSKEITYSSLSLENIKKVELIHLEQNELSFKVEIRVSGTGLGIIAKEGIQIYNYRNYNLNSGLTAAGFANKVKVLSQTDEFIVFEIEIKNDSYNSDTVWEMYVKLAQIDDFYLEILSTKDKITTKQISTGKKMCIESSFSTFKFKKIILM